MIYLILILQIINIALLVFIILQTINYDKIFIDIQNKLMQIENSIFDIYTKLKSITLTNQTCNTPQERETNVFGIEDFIITYIAPSDGFFAMEVGKCELRVGDATKIIVVEKLKGFYLCKNDLVSIINPTNLKYIRFTSIED